MKKEQSVEEAGRVWRSSVAELNDLKRAIRAEAEAKIESEVKFRRERAARAINYARNRGATKTSLRQVTTKDHNDFEGYVELGIELEAKEGKWKPIGL